MENAESTKASGWQKILGSFPIDPKGGRGAGIKGKINITQKEIFEAKN